MIERKCFHCGNDTTNPKFCSRSCSASFSNKIPKRKLSRKCSHCENLVRNYRSTLCEHHFQTKTIEDRSELRSRTLESYYSRDSLKGLHPSSRSAHVRGLNRSWNKDMTQRPCVCCGYSKHVELAHIRPISSFPLTATLGEINSRENIATLCPNCHWEFDNGLLELPPFRE